MEKQSDQYIKGNSSKMTVPTTLHKEDRYLAFLDVLGFREIIRSDQDQIPAYYSALSEVCGELMRSPGNGTVENQILGDAIVLSEPIIKEGDDLASLRKLLVAVARIQNRLVGMNIWTRGAICRGFVHTDHKGFLTGEALARAYELESKTALYPRVILDPAILAKGFRRNGEDCGIQTPGDLIEEINIFKSDGNWGSKILFDWSDQSLLNFGDNTKRTPYLEKDVPLFVDYMSPFSTRESVWGQLRFNNVIQHLEGRVRSNIEHYQKYRWVRDYLIAVLMRNPLGHKDALERLQEL